MVIETTGDSISRMKQLNSGIGAYFRYYNFEFWLSATQFQNQANSYFAHSIMIIIVSFLYILSSNSHTKQFLQIEKSYTYNWYLAPTPRVKNT